MPGLLDQTAKPPMDAQGTTEQDETPNVTKEEQAAYDRFVHNGMAILYDQKAIPKIIESIKGDGNPVEGLANALVMLVMRLEDSAEQAGNKIDPDVLLHGGKELFEQMVDLAQRAGLPKLDEKQIESAFYLALDKYRTTRQEQGKLPVDQLKGDMQNLVQADKAGKADEILPGISEYAKNSPQPNQASAGQDVQGQPPPQRGG